MQVSGRRCRVPVLLTGPGGEHAWWGLEHPVLGQGCWLLHPEEKVRGAAVGVLGSSGLAWLSSAPSQDGGAATSAAHGSMRGRGWGPQGAGGWGPSAGYGGCWGHAGREAGGCGGPARAPA